MEKNILKECEKLARSIAFSTGTVEDIIQYYSIKRLNENVEKIDVESYNDEVETDSGLTL